MLRNLRYLIALLVITLSFLAGAATANIRDWLQPMVCVLLLNNSGQDIVSADIQLKSDEVTNTARIDMLPAHSRQVLYFHARGALTLSLEAKLDDGRILKSSSSYLQPGLVITSHLGFADIRNEHQDLM